MLADRERLIQASLADKQQLLRLDETAYRIGKSDLRSVSQSRMAVQVAEAAALHLHRERLTQRVTLHLALGGDFGVPALAMPPARELVGD